MRTLKTLTFNRLPGDPTNWLKVNVPFEFSPFDFLSRLSFRRQCCEWTATHVYHLQLGQRAVIRGSVVSRMLPRSSACNAVSEAIAGGRADNPKSDRSTLRDFFCCAVLIRLRASCKPFPASRFAMLAVYLVAVGRPNSWAVHRQGADPESGVDRSAHCRPTLSRSGWGGARRPGYGAVMNGTGSGKKPAGAITCRTATLTFLPAPKAGKVVAIVRAARIRSTRWRQSRKRQAFQNLARQDRALISAKN
jgi:hypothetical protein